MLSTVYVTMKKVRVKRFVHVCVWVRVCVCVRAHVCSCARVFMFVRICDRWIREARKRMPVVALLVLGMYAKHMGHVDRVDKNVALSRLRLKRLVCTSLYSHTHSRTDTNSCTLIHALIPSLLYAHIGVSSAITAPFSSGTSGLCWTIWSYCSIYCPLML